MPASAAGCRNAIPATPALKGDAAVATVRTATAHWEGPLDTGKGTVALDSSGLGSYELTWASRAEAPNGRTSPEELIAAAHSACFSMALSFGLAQGGHPPTSITTSADVSFALPAGITGIKLSVRAVVPGITAAEFAAAAEDAKQNCPVSKALTGTEIELTATLDQ
jgi:osmotically inducible protein OsmC